MSQWPGSQESLDGLQKKVFEKCLMRGQFRLKSGQVSDVYFDKYKLESSPELFWPVIRHLWEKLRAYPVDVWAGLELGGVGLALGLSAVSGYPCVFVRKKPKEYGTSRQIEGLDALAGRSVAIVEDVLTTGSEVVRAIQALEAQKAHVRLVTAVWVRGDLKALKRLPVTIVSLWRGLEGG